MDENSSRRILAPFQSVPETTPLAFPSWLRHEGKIWGSSSQTFYIAFEVPTPQGSTPNVPRPRGKIPLTNSRLNLCPMVLH